MEYGHFKEENFSKRHIGLNEEDKRNILKKLGYETMDKFIKQNYDLNDWARFL